MVLAPHSSQCDVATPDGASLRVLIDGEGPDLLLVSGLGGTAAFWDAAAAGLSRQFRVIRLDQRGIGASSRGTAPCTISQLGHDCATVLDKAGSRKAVILGHSTGGCIAMSLACEAPERITGLVLSATWARPNRYMQALFVARRALLEHEPRSYATLACLMSYPPAWLEANWHVHDAALAKAPVTPEAIAVVRERIEALLSFDGTAFLKQLPMPTMVLGARDDLIVPSFLQEELAASLTGSVLHMLETGGHFFPHTREEQFLGSISSFLDQCR